jgi:predicted amidophosphoribosyltransferase
VICPGCQRDNHPRRRYCGRCGSNLDPICRSCSFANDRDDRFCGGCGVSLAIESARASQVVAAAPHPATVPPVAATASPVTALPVAALPVAALPVAALPVAALPVDELAGLFSPRTPAEEGSRLPEAGIVQNDLDRLFGGVR